MNKRSQILRSAWSGILHFKGVDRLRINGSCINEVPTERNSNSLMKCSRQQLTVRLNAKRLLMFTNYNRLTRRVFCRRTMQHKFEEIIIANSLKHPGYSYDELSLLCHNKGLAVSSSTIQIILTKYNLETVFKRCHKIEEKYLQENIELTAEQVRQTEKINPCFRERYVKPRQIGELLVQDIFEVGTIKGIGKVFLHAVVDTSGSFAFGFLSTSTAPEYAVKVVHKYVLPFYQERGVAVRSILTSDEMCSKETRLYKLYLALIDIRHQNTKVKGPKINGFMDLFNRIALNEFFLSVLQKEKYDSVEALQADFDQWLHYYNYERPHLGYPNFGKRPSASIDSAAL
ncbi:MAG: integrase, catalytic region [Firmicutes bacterium]|nr:integrase, catalytic region [Bacillota bacterium]